MHHENVETVINVTREVHKSRDSQTTRMLYDAESIALTKLPIHTPCFLKNYFMFTAVNRKRNQIAVQ
jgi:hypothetical protein